MLNTPRIHDIIWALPKTRTIPITIAPNQYHDILPNQQITPTAINPIPANGATSVNISLESVVVAPANGVAAYKAFGIWQNSIKVAIYNIFL